MSYIELIDEAAAEGELGRIYEQARERAGGVANILKVMSRDVNSLRGSMALYLGLMKTENALSEARRELLATVVSNINDCYY